MTPSYNWRRDFREGPNNGRIMFDLKHHQVGTVVDGDGMTIVDAEGDESGKVARHYICRRGIIVTIYIVDVPWEGGDDKDLGARSRSSRRGRGRKHSQAGRGLFNRIHRVIVKYLTGKKHNLK
jgi:hypothetical protein